MEPVRRRSIQHCLSRLRTLHTMRTKPSPPGPMLFIYTFVTTTALRASIRMMLRVASWPVAQPCPSLHLVSVQGHGLFPTCRRALALIRAWQTLPDFVSVNFHEEGAEEVAQSLYRRGVGIELGLSTPYAAERARAAGWDQRCIRILLEPSEIDAALALANVQKIERILDAARTTAPRLLHGSEATTWPLLIEAARHGYQCRIGFEDTLQLPTGEPARRNAELVSAARALMTLDG